MKLVAENSRIGLYVARMRSFQLLGPSSTIELVPVALETQQFFSSAAAKFPPGQRVIPCEG